MPKKASPGNRYPMQSFSISAQNADVIDILKKQENKTKFICEAIREKYKNDSAAQLMDSSEKLLEEKVQEILLRLYGDNITIIASNKSAFTFTSFVTSFLMSLLPNSKYFAISHSSTILASVSFFTSSCLICVKRFSRILNV